MYFYSQADSVTVVASMVIEKKKKPIKVEKAQIITHRIIGS